MRRALIAGCSALVLALTGCGGDDPSSSPEPSPTTGPSASASPSPSSTPSQKPTKKPSQTASSKPSKTPTGDPNASVPARKRSVLAISVDGLSVEALAQLGPTGAPAYFQLLEGGAATLNARTAVEQTATLPNHAGMLTGRRIDARSGGHGLTWNDEVPGSEVPGQGDGVESVFDVIRGAGGSTAVFAGKEKFATFERSWGDAIDEFEVDLDNDRLVDAARADLTSQRRRLTFVHIPLPDTVGHAAGWMSPAYLDAVRKTDELVGELLATIEDTPRLDRRTVVVLTADHGGDPGTRDHGDPSALGSFRIPFVVWGVGVETGDLYELNPDYRDPGTDQPSYDGPQPVRNGHLANLVTELLGLGPVPGSGLNAAQDLDVTRN